MFKFRANRLVSNYQTNQVEQEIEVLPTFYRPRFLWKKKCFFCSRLRLDEHYRNFRKREQNKQNQIWDIFNSSNGKKVSISRTIFCLLLNSNWIVSTRRKCCSSFAQKLFTTSSELFSTFDLPQFCIYRLHVQHRCIHLYWILKHRVAGQKGWWQIWNQT